MAAVRRQLSLERLASSSAAAQGYERMSDATVYTHDITNNINQRQPMSLEMPATRIQIEPPLQEGKPPPSQSQPHQQQQQQQDKQQQQQQSGGSFPSLTEIQFKQSDLITALVHLYRGEVGRLGVYRQRLDTSTNWAITLTGGLMVVSVGNETISSAFFAVIASIVLFICLLEARRYRYYLVSHERCRLMEGGLYGEALFGRALRQERDRDTHTPARTHVEKEKGTNFDNWREELHDSLVCPRFPINLIEAIGVRFRRNYVYLISGVFFGWLFKVLNEDEASAIWLPLVCSVYAIIVIVTFLFLPRGDVVDV